ncbi:aminoacetone oxidase family FAD-binding enzyme [Roseovarius spongiae]|uniref:Aminoacetone oxidase family FAD-binding enzyme n=1 Tax=Roseovarius spongiae TaxID=2320272 RepID=A0A3A8AXJ0_9RHOB|nr:aminoacetone oxidase family FAD-binding enzyme [Roseovarius spongiae]RKF14801.1 aminoacetone oxidase family FAD-binding enzyme [Roseovarius spongiae]
MQIDTLILGAGAAGMMCAAHAGGRTLVIDHAKAPGEKIRISGGGRCNFTNLHCGPENFLSANPHFCKSALARYTQWDFIDLVDRHGIAWREKTLGQLFCDGSAREIIAMLRAEMERAGADLWLRTSLADLSHDGARFIATLEREGARHRVTARNLVLATGGKSIPKMGATGIAYDIARQFGLPVTETRAGLVPFTFAQGRFAALAGVSLPVRASCGAGRFDEALLFTHRGLSGPAMLQLSSYWRESEEIAIDLDPDGALLERLRAQRGASGGHRLTTELARHLPARLAAALPDLLGLSLAGNLADQGDAALTALCARLRDWRLTPAGTEGYRTAEVTLGGIDTGALDARSLRARAVPGLYAIGEAVDVTGWLGGYNFQWAWASGMAAARAIKAPA